MMQSLLTERFQLQVRRESKNGPISTLVVAKNGPKLKLLATRHPQHLALRQAEHRASQACKHQPKRDLPGA